MNNTGFLFRKSLALVLSAVWIAGPLPSVLAADPSAQASTAGDKAYLISPGDIVSIVVFPVAEYSREVTVQPDGKIELPLIGSLLVKGLTSRELQDLLRERYGKYVANPQVTVNVRHFAGRRVAIIGEVRTPGYYEYRDGMKLLELVSQVGGTTEFAATTRVRILRADSPRKGITVDLKEVLEGRLDRDPLLLPGDTVYVPKQRFAMSASWITGTVYPWATLATLIATLVILSRQ